MLVTALFKYLPPMGVVVTLGPWPSLPPSTCQWPLVVVVVSGVGGVAIVVVVVVVGRTPPTAIVVEGRATPTPLRKLRQLLPTQPLLTTKVLLLLLFSTRWVVGLWPCPLGFLPS